MNWTSLREWWRERLAAPQAKHLRTGQRGESAARTYLCEQGLKFLTANFRGRRGEIDLVLRDGDCLVFVEVKTRSAESWTRPAAAVRASKRKRISLTTLAYLRELRELRVKIRFDIVEVLMEEGAVHEIRHLPNTFSLSPPYRFG